MNYSIVQESRIGGREVNQDRAASAATDEAVLLVVADGMGGHMQGEVAAQIAIDTLTEQFRLHANPYLEDPAAFLAVTMQTAHQTIVAYAEQCRIPVHAAPRTTCIACVIQSGMAVWAHAGDSRLYLIHSNSHSSKSVVHTRDHSVVQRLLDDGEISAEAAANHPWRHRVFSCLGGDIEPQIEVSQPVALMAGDVLALCTDGAWAPMGPEAEQMVATLGRSPLTSSLPHFMDTAESAAGERADNLTIIALRWEAAPECRPGDPASESDTITVVLADAAGASLPRAAETPISDEELERAIAEIRRRIPNVINPDGPSS